MSDPSPELTGPDLAAGLAEHDLPEGAKVLGHADGHAVLLVRSGGEAFAIGAHCTHYGAPLADGLIVGDTVRCPWHHACFSLRSGAVERAPALDPVPCWRVERRGDRLHVTTRIEPVPSPSPAEAPSSVVIVGGGAAANAAAEMLRRDGYAGPVTLLSADADVPVDRPNLSKDYLAGTAHEGWIPLRPVAFYEERRIDLRLGVRVTALDPLARRVTLEGGETLAYGALLLATGADPIRPDIPGADAAHVRCFRSFADSRGLVEAAATARSVVVIGAGFLGLEVAASLRTRGLAVHVVAPDTRPLARVLGDAVGDLVRSVHEAHGVVFHLSDGVARIEPDRVVLASGATLPADLVVVAVGVRPATAIAEGAGLVVDRGVLVDAYLKTSALSVFAAGDVARFPDGRTGESARVEHWVVAQRQGRVAARNILGARERFDAVPFFWSAHYDLTIAYVGHAPSWDRIDLDGDLAARDAAIAYRRGGQTLAIATIGRDAASLEAEAAMERGDEAALARIVPRVPLSVAGGAS